MSTSPVFALRLPASIKQAAQQLAAEDGASLNQFVATAVAEKIAVMRAETLFGQRASRADKNAALRVLRRAGGQSPAAGDESQ